MEDLTKWRWGKGSVQGRDEGEAGLCGLLRDRAAGAHAVRGESLRGG